MFGDGMGKQDQPMQMMVAKFQNVTIELCVVS
jgi:hypothetical protein